MWCYAFMWISVSLAVTTAVILTDSSSPLWTFLIPAFIGCSTKEESKK